ncbi:hypothetical protein [Micromonospora sp. MH33]|uniref:hypothetical protein n=1 Tax=Micromonospora sp. MH33 TaxID=1945509 RepID=UPI0011B26083|nr:hypothetical protein [Micromonospora sp. MH33]
MQMLMSSGVATLASQALTPTRSRTERNRDRPGRSPPATRCVSTAGPALTFRLNGDVDTVLALRIDNGLIRVCAVRNPEKLSRINQETAVSRVRP